MSQNININEWVYENYLIISGSDLTIAVLQSLLAPTEIAKRKNKEESRD